ncbi:MAG: DUF58 domain-containing protein [Alkalispirochaeta sp.]
MALLVGVGLVVALTYGLLVAVVRWIRLSRAEVRRPTHTWEVRRGHRCEPPPALSLVGVPWIIGAPATVELVAGSRTYTGATHVIGRAVPTIHVSCDTVPRGVYQLRRVTIRLTDLLSLFTVVCQHTGSNGESGELPILRVLPVPSPVGDTPIPPGFVAGTRGDGSSRDRSDDLIEARPYHPGDDTRRINWKTYAHSETLFVRIGEEIPPPSFSADVLVDTRGVNAFSHLDRLISVALGVAEELERRNCTVTLSAQVDEYGPRTLGTVDAGCRALAAVDPLYGFLADGDRLGPRGSRLGGGHTLGRGRTLVVGTSWSPGAPPGAAQAILAWDYDQPEGGGNARTISVLD